jgi:hypothetical protein
VRANFRSQKGLCGAAGGVQIQTQNRGFGGPTNQAIEIADVVIVGRLEGLYLDRIADQVGEERRQAG